MAGTNIDLGQQQVSIYSQQQLSSVYGNTILKGVIEPGVYNTSVEISKVGDNLLFTVAQGSTFVFKRTGISPDSITRELLGKVVIGGPSGATISKLTPLTGPDSTSTACYRDWETDRKSTRLNSSHLKLSRMPSSA